MYQRKEFEQGDSNWKKKLKKRNHNVLVELHHLTNTHYWLNLGDNNNFEHTVCKNTFWNILGVFLALGRL
jgi:hypothetical protein